jgi:DNA-binding SARP family transcriptional activator/pimeloyl-ACP methyl ester carboxylesterase
MAQPQLSLLGGFVIAGGGTPGATFTRKARAMLAYLALQPGHPQSREKLAALLWGGNGEAQARTSLRQALAAIRRALPIVTEGDAIGLDLDGIELDVARFEALAAGAEPDALEQAMALYRGDLLDGFSVKEEPFEDWLRVERERLRALAVGALEKLIAHGAAHDDPANAVKAAIRLLSLEPLREDMHRALMQAYAAQGRFNLALKQYEICRAALAQELGLQPDPETRALYDSLRGRRTASTSAAESVFLLSRHVPVRRPRTHYVKSAGCNIAYQVTGDGPIDLIYVPGWVSNLDYAWANPRFAHVLDRLGAFARLIRFDKRGTGLSDRGHAYATLEQRMQDVRAVLDATGSARPVVFGSSEGGNMCMLFAASYPERTAALVLNGAYARGLWAEDYRWARTRDEVEEELAAVERNWGEPADLKNAAPSLLNDPLEREWFAANARNSASPADAIAAWRWSTEIDMRDILPSIRVPTLILQRNRDRWVKVEEGRYLAEHIAGARYIELDGDDHVIWGQDPDTLVDCIRDYVATLRPVEASEHVLMTVLAIAAPEPTDDVQRAEGILTGRNGDTWLAVFRGPTQAIQCAKAIRAKAGSAFRAAVHIGECERRGDAFGGPILDATARLIEHAGRGEIVVSRTVRDILTGAGLALEARGAVYRLRETQV